MVKLSLTIVSIAYRINLRDEQISEIKLRSISEEFFFLSAYFIRSKYSVYYSVVVYYLHVTAINVLNFLKRFNFLTYPITTGFYKVSNLTWTFYHSSIVLMQFIVPTIQTFTSRTFPRYIHDIYSVFQLQRSSNQTAFFQELSGTILQWIFPWILQSYALQENRRSLLIILILIIFILC